MHRRIPLTCHCEEAQPTWQSRSTRPDRRKAIGESATASPRFPRRFAPRNDKPGSIARSAKPLYNLPACKALTGRRYRRNWLVRFYRYLVRTGSAFPRLPRRACALLAMTREGGDCKLANAPLRRKQAPKFVLTGLRMRAFSPVLNPKLHIKRRSHHVLYEMRKQDPG